MSDVARRVGGIVTESQSPWGQAIDVDQARRDAQGRAFKLVCMVHAETSTGALSETAPLRALADELGALLLVDAVTSVGGVPVAMDAHRIDALYSGTQKCLSCPPGLSPVSLSARARELLFARKTSTPSWYGDLSLITRYWGSERAYHHTAPINMLMALHEALRLVLMEGLEARYARHELHGTALRSGLLAMGLTLPVPPAARMPQLTLVQVPPGVDEARVRAHLLREHGLEIGAGLGTFKGKAFRIGLMGESATRRNVTLCLSALFGALQREGFAVREHPLAAADEAYAGA
jgi:alanine-glyoxylate transaminase/serine-glyoxylate transaminase/serine-pyruvate transaminase